MRMLQKIKIMFEVFIFLIIFSTVTFAHSGRTDSNGGHKDKNNVSGLGGYHYHCGGYPAHLHTNGVCPYNSNANTVNEKADYTARNSNISNNSSKNKDTTSQSLESQYTTSIEKNDLQEENNQKEKSVSEALESSTSESTEKKKVTEQTEETEENKEKDTKYGVVATGVIGLIGYGIYKCKKK